MKKYRNRKTGEEVTAEIRNAPAPFTEGHDVLMQDYVELYISTFRKILFKSLEELKNEWVEVKKLYVIALMVKEIELDSGQCINAPKGQRILFGYESEEVAQKKANVLNAEIIIMEFQEEIKNEK